MPKTRFLFLGAFKAPPYGRVKIRVNHKELSGTTDKVKPRSFHVFRIHEVDEELKQFDKDLVKNQSRA